MKLSIAILLILILMAVCIPRFNRSETFLNKIGIDAGQTQEGRNDSVQYVLLLKHFRGEDILSETEMPFRRRILAPAIASVLPFDPMTSLNVLNIAALIISMWILWLILKTQRSNYWSRVLGCLMFAFSFPVFWYGAIGYIEPFLLCLVMAGVYFIITEKWLLVMIVVFLGTLTKLSVIVLFPPIVAALIITKAHREKWFTILTCSISALCLAYFLSRTIMLTEHGYDWIKHSGVFLYNISRPRSVLSNILTFGIPGFLSLFMLKNIDMKRDGIFISGLIGVLLLTFAHFFTSYADGRTIWLSYPFTIPMAVSAVESWRKK